MTPALTFRGASGEVTGSCFEIEALGRRFMVDCGLVQGDRDADERNRAALSRRDRERLAAYFDHVRRDDPTGKPTHAEW